MMLNIVTWNRKAILQQCLEAIFETTKEESPTVLISDNGSEDGTPELLKDLSAQGKLKAWLLPENYGIAKARNAHWHECIGKDALKLDDKVLFLVPGWLTMLKMQSDTYHALVGIPYDPVVQPLWRIAPILDFMPWNQAGEGGPLTFVPGEVSAVLGAWDEIPGCLYGWEEILYQHRAKLLGWNYGFSLRIPCKFLASASTKGREHAMQFHVDYERLDREYKEAERDLCIPIEESEGYKIGKGVRSESAV